MDGIGAGDSEIEDPWAPGHVSKIDDAGDARLAVQRLDYEVVVIGIPVEDPLGQTGQDGQDLGGEEQLKPLQGIEGGAAWGALFKPLDKDRRELKGPCGFREVPASGRERWRFGQAAQDATGTPQECTQGPKKCRPPFCDPSEGFALHPGQEPDAVQVPGFERDGGSQRTLEVRAEAGSHTRDRLCKTLERIVLQVQEDNRLRCMGHLEDERVTLG